MANLLDNTEIEISCGNCKRKTKKSIAWIKSHSDFKCTCGIKVSIDTQQLKKEIGKIEKQLASFKNLGK